MSLSKMSKEDLELLSHKDITYYILEEEGKMNTADLFKRVVTPKIKASVSVISENGS